MQNDDNFVYDDMNELIKQVNSNEDFLKVVPREKSEEEPTPEELQTMSLRDLFGYLSDKFALGINAFLDFLELSSEFSDELDERYKQKIAELEAMTHEEQEQFDVAEFWREQIDYVIQLKKQQQSELSKAHEKKPKKEGAHSFSASEIKELLVPIDKINTEIWKRLEYGKQTELKAETDADSIKGKRADILVTLDLSDTSGITLSRELTFYDERVFSVIGTLAYQGVKYVTANQIYRQMGNRSQPGTAEREKIISSVKYMLKTLVTVDNTQENALYPKYEHIKGTFQLLNAEIVEAYANGTLTDDVILIEKIPKLFDIALKKRQYATIPAKVLETPISQTPANLELEKYLIKRISQAKNDLNKSKKSREEEKIVLSTVFDDDNCAIKKGKPRTRAIEKIEKLLAYWKKVEWINGYYSGDKADKKEKAESEKEKKAPDSFTVILKK